MQHLKTFKGSLILILAWLLGAIIVSSFHEVWRDEVRALSIAISSDSLFTILSVLENEGHPFLWYSLLWTGFQIFNTPVTLKILSIAVAFVSIVAFWVFSPFKTWFKALFIFSFLPFYEYSVMCRNYGISMLLFFLFATFYTRKGYNSLALGPVLFLLANTNFHSTLLVGLLILFLLFDYAILRHRSEENLQFKQNLILFFTIIWGCVGIGVSMYTVMPTEASIFYSERNYALYDLLPIIIKNAYQLGAGYNYILPGVPVVMVTLVIWLLALGLIREPTLFITAILGVVGIAAFFEIGYAGSLRHQGIVFIFLLTLYWIGLFKTEKSSLSSYKLGKTFFYLCLYGVLAGVLGLQVIGSARYIYRDIAMSMSSSKDFADLILENQDYAEVIIIGEPDLRIESLPYYINNKIYMPREGKFKKTVSLTKDNKSLLTLDQLLSDVKAIKEVEQKPIILAFGHFGIDNQSPPFSRFSEYNKNFTWSYESLKEFEKISQKIGEFKQSVKNERYEIYVF